MSPDTELGSTGDVPLPGGGMTGEDTESDSLQTAEYWAAAYVRLVDLEERVLETMRGLGAREEEPVRAAVAAHNIAPLVTDLEFFRERLGFWRSRVAELRGEMSG